MRDFSAKVPLGRTGLLVSRLGIGSAYNVSERACRTAFDAGVNYFFWGSVRTPGMALAIREISRAHRDDLVVVLQCYARRPALMRLSVERALKKLRLDRADILLLGWHETPPEPRTLEAAEKLRESGRFRYLGISSHQRPLFREFLRDSRYEVFHLRYNAAHRGAEQDIFPCLPDQGGPGIVSFTNTRWGDLLKPENMPPGTSPPSAADCYRFSLSHPCVHVALCGPKNDAEMQMALSALDAGPVEGSELEDLRRIGDHVHGIRSMMSVLT